MKKEELNELQKFIIEVLPVLKENEGKDFKGIFSASIYKLYYDLKKEDVKNIHRSTVSQTLRELMEAKLIWKGGFFLTEKGEQMASELAGKSPTKKKEETNLGTKSVEEPIPPVEAKVEEKEEDKPEIPTATIWDDKLGKFKRVEKKEESNPFASVKRSDSCVDK